MKDTKPYEAVLKLHKADLGMKRQFIKYFLFFHNTPVIVQKTCKQTVQQLLWIQANLKFKVGGL